MFQQTQPILITLGEPSGISGEICLKLALNSKLTQFLAEHKIQLKLVVLGNIALLQNLANKFNLPVEILAIKSLDSVPNYKFAQLCVMDFALPSQVELGVLDAKNAKFVLDIIKFATQECLAGRASAMVTAPLHKGIINQSGVKFSGHTEYLQELCNAKEVVMMLTADKLRVALVTTHLALKDVPAAITPAKLRQVIEILHKNLQKLYKIETPNIGVCGLNPHAGEGGYLGWEEIEIINPTLATMKQEGYNLSLALPADTIFTPDSLKDKDAILCMYHDQGLPTLKYAGWDIGVNITLGLPIIRTSPDHGTALGIVNAGIASEASLVAALLEAVRIVF